MRILVISGYNPYENSSANLSHNAYIKGMTELGHKVDLLCFSDSDGKKRINESNSSYLDLNHIYMYDGLSYYEKLSRKSAKPIEINTDELSASTNTSPSAGLKQKVFSKTKRMIRSIYGVYNPSIVWYFRARKFANKEKYDIVVSMSYPQVSHLLAKYLIKKNRVRCNKWIQLWEDPWAADLGNMDGFEKCVKPEGNLLNAAEDIVYVSPITMEHQKQIFPANKTKMRWCPLASYYRADLVEFSSDENHYGYFGDYSPNIRNLKPFYNVAVKMRLHTEICGSPDDLFKSEGNVKIFPRMPLEQLKEHENKANVVICLFNLGGGQIPGKIYQLAATNKIVVAILDGPEEEQTIIRGFFEKYRRFVFCQNNEQSISEVIDSIENNNFGGVSNEPIDCFSVEKVAKVLLGE